MSAGDPHVTSFSGEWWECHAYGKVTLFEHTPTGIKVIGNQKRMNKWTPATVHDVAYIESSGCPLDAIKIDASGAYANDAKLEVGAEASEGNGYTIKTQDDGHNKQQYRITIPATGIVVVVQPWHSHENTYFNIYINVPEGIIASESDWSGVCLSNSFCKGTEGGYFPDASSTGSQPPVDAASTGSAPSGSTGGHGSTGAPAASTGGAGASTGAGDDLTKDDAERACYPLAVNKDGSIDFENPAYKACLYDTEHMGDVEAATALFDAVAWRQQVETDATCEQPVQDEISTALAVASVECSSCLSSAKCSDAVDKYQEKVGANLICLRQFDNVRALYNKILESARKCEKAGNVPAEGEADMGAAPQFGPSLIIFAVLTVASWMASFI
jgi:hypothetical protein